MVEFVGKWSPSGVDDMSAWTSCEGVVDNTAVSTKNKAKSDGFDLVATIPSARDADNVVGGIERLVPCQYSQGGVVEPAVVRFSQDLIELRTSKHSRVPRRLYFSPRQGLGKGVVELPLTERRIEEVSGKKSILYVEAGDLNFSVSNDRMAVLQGVVTVPIGGGYKELSVVIPLTHRPRVDVEFPVVHGESVSRLKIYTDGRIVVDSGFISASPYTAPVHLYACFGLHGGSSGLRVEKVGDRVLVEGRVSVESDVTVAKVKVGEISVEFRPKFPVFSFVLNKIHKPSGDLRDRVSTIEVTTAGDILLHNTVCDSANPCGKEVCLVREIALFGLTWSTTAGHSDLSADIVQSRLTVEDVETVGDFVAEGVYDASVRLVGVGKFDCLKFRQTVLAKHLARQRSVIEGKSQAVSVWAERLLEEANVCGGEGVDVVSHFVSKRIVENWNFSKIISKLKTVFPKHNNNSNSSTNSTSSPSVTAAGAMMIPVHRQLERNDMFRFGGSRKCFHQLNVAKRASREELETLGEIVRWWNQWNTNEKYLSHSSLMGNQDMFTDTGKWAIPDDPATQATLFKYMAWIYKKGYDTFISEIQTPLFPLIEDLDMESTLDMTDTNQMDLMFLDESLVFIKERARALKVIYPERDSFTCYIYSSSGFNKSKGRWKSSFHLVWPDLIVNAEMAPIIRQTTVEYFVYRSGVSRFFQHMQARLVNHYEANIWENVFDQTTSNANNGLRMPFCNKATWIKTAFGTKVPSVENRRCFPKGEIKISFASAEFDSELLREAAKERALRLIDDAAIAAEQCVTIEDQNVLVGDRTQYKEASKTSVSRTSAFVAGMRSNGGDLREMWKVHAEWVERVDQSVVDQMSNEEIAKWIQRGSCRRGPQSGTTLSEFNKSFVDCYLKADVKWFQGHTIETLRASELYRKLTPAGQQGIKTRFRKYLQAQAAAAGGSGLVGSERMIKMSGKDDLTRLHQLAEDRIARQAVTVQEAMSGGVVADVGSGSEDEDEGGEFESPPVGDDHEMFEMWHGSLENVFEFRGSIEEWKNLWSEKVRGVVELNGGYWLHAPHAATWLSPNAYANEPSGGWGSCLVQKYKKREDPVSVGMYHQAGKVVVCGSRQSVLYKRLVQLVAAVTGSAGTEGTGGLYHKLVLPDLNNTDMMEGISFPLLDRASAQAQRIEYQDRWEAMANGGERGGMNEANIELST